MKWGQATHLHSITISDTKLDRVRPIKLKGAQKQLTLSVENNGMRYDLVKPLPVFS